MACPYYENEALGRHTCHRNRGRICLSGIWATRKRVIQAQRTSSSQVGARPQKNEQSAEQQTIQAIRGLIAQDLRIRQQYADQQRADANQANDNIAIQGKLAKYTRALVWVGLLQAAVLACTIFVIYLQITTMRAIERAWVVVDIKHEDMQLETKSIHIGDAVDETTSVPLTCISFNGGKSPAWVIEKRIRFEIFENAEAIPRTPPLKLTSVFDDIPHTVYTREHSAKADMPIAQGRLKDGKVGVIYGAVRYRDIFNKIRTTTFGYKVLPVADRFSLRLERLKNRPKYNENT